MRKLFFKLLLLFSASVASGQPYESIFGNNSSSWTRFQMIPDGGWTDSFYVAKDTSFGDFNYKEIRRGDNYDYTYLREDITTGRVWSYSKEYQTEYLVMDLSLNVGDGFLIKDQFEDSIALIDSVYYIDGRKHIRVNFDKDYSSDPNRLIFIEGIGPNKGFDYQHIWSEHYDYYDLTLLCAYKDNNHIYLDSTHGVCNITFTGTSQEQSKLTWKIYPNPAKEYITVTSSLPYSQNITINIFNPQGKLVKEITESNFNSIKIERADIPNGIYLVQFKSDDGLIIFFEKIIFE